LIPEQKVEHILAPQRHAWIQVVSGDVVLNGQELHEGDGAAVSEETSLSFAGSGSVGGEFLLFDLA
jgi:redox-sensitive bicupin YhaK (pirin superfamily)